MNDEKNLHLRTHWATLALLSYYPDFWRASITRYTRAKHEPTEGSGN